MHYMCRQCPHSGGTTRWTFLQRLHERVHQYCIQKWSDRLLLVLGKDQITWWDTCQECKTGARASATFEIRSVVLYLHSISLWAGALPFHLTMCCMIPDMCIIMLYRLGSLLSTQLVSMGTWNVWNSYLRVKPVLMYKKRWVHATIGLSTLSAHFVWIGLIRIESHEIVSTLQMCNPDKLKPLPFIDCKWLRAGYFNPRSCCSYVGNKEKLVVS